ncbi:MAG TPA: histidine phosphatase family protein [Victivallales bacterium]|nr:histidine phosphatase family protein [Victivallales bacterium]
MLKLYLFRHAKSSWDNPGISDFDRPLSKRGLGDAPRIGKIYGKLYKMPDLVITSSARRALETAELISDRIGYSIDRIVQDGRIYAASVYDLVKVIRKLDNDNKTVLLFGHNPGVTSLANYLTGVHIDNMPTCSFVSINFRFDKWKKVTEEAGEFVLFDYPKNHK